MSCLTLCTQRRFRLSVIAVFSLLWAAWPLTPALATDNTATGNILGVDGDLDDSNTFVINSTQLGLVKAAFLTDGTALASGANIPRGMNVKFLIYVDNSTDVVTKNVNIGDVLDANFVYQTTSIKIDNTVATGANAAAIYASIDAKSAINDAVESGDEAGIAVATISAGSSAGNKQLDVPAGKVWAMLFTVRVQ